MKRVRSLATRPPNEGGSRPQETAGGRVTKRGGHGAKTGAVRDRALAALMTEPSVGLAARRVGVGERTLRRWLVEDTEFIQAYAEARAASFNAAMARVQAASGRAVETLEDLLEAKKHPSVRLGAARTIIELGLHEHDAATLLRKLEELERWQREAGNTTGMRSRIVRMV